MLASFLFAWNQPLGLLTTGFRSSRSAREQATFPVLCCAALLLGVIVSGCASFPQDELPKYGYEQIEAFEMLPAVDYELTFSAMGNPNAAGLAFFAERVQLVFGASGAFTGFQPGIGGESHHLRLSLDNHGNAGLAAFSGFISGLTFTILPGYAKDEYKLVAEVSRGDQMLKRYEYHDSMSTWIQILLVFAMPFNSPADVSKEVIDNMIRNLIVDLGRDGILEQDATHADGQIGGEDTTLEELTELKILLDEGLITKEQYDKMREQILNEL
jgi:hypothetical protein